MDAPTPPPAFERCLFWVIRAALNGLQPFPQFTRELTFACAAASDVTGHFLPHALQQNACHFAVGHREVSQTRRLARDILRGSAAGMIPLRLSQMAIEIGRRQFIASLGGVTVAWPLAASAQQLGKVPTIGFLGGSASIWDPWRAAFVERLRQLGWIENRTIAIVYRWTEGYAERTADFATEFVRLKVDVIVTASPATEVVKQVTSNIPIVFAIGNDPIGTGLIASLARPGGNVTGLSNQATDLAAKQLQLLQEIVPNLRRLAILADVGDPNGVREMREVQTTAHALGIEVTPLEIRRADDIAAAFTALNADALYVVQGPLVGVNQTLIITRALGLRLPLSFPPRDHVKAGALMSYGPDFPDLFRRTADLVDKVLHGTKPADIPVEQPIKFDFVINLITAKALGLTVPPNLLSIADDVIE